MLRLCVVELCHIVLTYFKYVMGYEHILHMFCDSCILVVVLQNSGVVVICILLALKLNVMVLYLSVPVPH